MTLPPKRVLMIDDDKDESDILKEAFNEINITITFKAISDRRQILDSFTLTNKFHPDIIFLDMNMPGINGLECLEYIRKSSLFKGVFVIMYSTSDFIRDIEEAYARGANLYIKKQNTFLELKNILVKVLQLEWENYVPRPDREKFVWGMKE